MVGFERNVALSRQVSSPVVVTCRDEDRRGPFVRDNDVRARKVCHCRRRLVKPQRWPAGNLRIRGGVIEKFFQRQPSSPWPFRRYELFDLSGEVAVYRGGRARRDCGKVCAGGRKGRQPVDAYG